MRGLILAAGRGRRMGELTESIPKCLAKVNNQTLLDWQLSALKSAGINELAMVRGHLAEKLTPPNLKLYLNPIWEKSNMVRSLLDASEWLEVNECIVSYSDIIYSADTVKILAQMEEDICLVFDPNWWDLWSQRFLNPLEDAESFQINNLNYLTDIGRKYVGREEIKGQFIGLFKFTKQGFEIVTKFLNKLSDESINKLDITSLFQLLIKDDQKILAFPMRDKWYEVDNFNDLKLYNELPYLEDASFFSY